MKKVLSVILVIIMMALFTACGSGSSGSGGAAPAQSASAPSKSEESPDVIPGTKLAMPDKETDVASKKTEIIETTDNPDYDLQINVYYESAEEASTA